MFVGSVVAGCVVLASHGAKARGALLRDVGTYAAAITLVAGFLLSGHMSTLQASLLVAMYIGAPWGWSVPCAAGLRLVPWVWSGGMGLRAWNSAAHVVGVARMQSGGMLCLGPCWILSRGAPVPCLLSDVSSVCRVCGHSPLC